MGHEVEYRPEGRTVRIGGSHRSAHVPLALASGGCLLFAIGIDSLAAHHENVGVLQWFERTGPSHGQFLAVASAVIALWHRFPRAWRAAARFRPNASLLLVAGVGVAAAYGWWFAAATTAFVSALWSAIRESRHRSVGF